MQSLSVPSLLTRMFTLLLIGLLGACSGIQVDSTPTERFEEGGYKTYSWWSAPIKGTESSNEPLDLVDPAIRKAVDEQMAGKGYSLVPKGGDFLIDYQFKASLSEGALNSTARMADNSYPLPSNQVGVINRRTDQALVDNAYALGGPREMNSILLRFSDSKSKSLVWAASMSKLVEDVNGNNAQQLFDGIERAVTTTLRRLPDAP